MDTLEDVTFLGKMFHYGFQNDTCEYFIREWVFVSKQPKLGQTDPPWR